MFKNMLTKLQNAPRTWPVIAASVLACVFLLPGMDLIVLVRFVTFFTVAVSLAWAALRVLWIERTCEVEHDAAAGRVGSNVGLARANCRDLCYAIVVTGCVIAAASASL